MPVNRKRNALLSLMALWLLQVGTASLALPFDLQFLRVTDYGRPVNNGIATADFTGDGIDEVFVASSNQVRLLLAFTQEPGALKMAQFFKLPIEAGGVTELHVWRGGSGPQLVMVASHGWPQAVTEVRIYAGWPLTELTSYSFPTGHSTSAVGDLNNDGHPELVITRNDQTRVLRLINGLPRLTLPSSFVGDIVLANLDADPALEVILAAFPSRVYDGVTGALEGTYPDGFGSFMAAGNIGSGGAPGFVEVRDWHSVTVFGGAPWSPLWSYSVSDIDAVAVANLDGIGADEIIVGDGQWGSIRIFDSQTRTLRIAIPNPGNGIPALTPVQTTNAPGKDLVFSAETWGPEKSVMRVVRSSDGATLRELTTEFGGAGATLIGDFNADGRVELVVANSGVEPGRIRFIDRDTGVQEWVSPATAGINDPFAMNPGFLLQTQLDADPAMELVVVGGAGYDGRIIVLDGLTKEVQLQIGNFSTSRPLPFREVIGAALLDYDADGFDDIAVITQPTSGGGSGARVHVFSLLTGLALWESISMGSGSSTTAQGIFVQPGNGQDLLVAALPTGLRAFGVQSQLLEWTHTAPVARAIYMPSAPAGAEIVLEDEDGTVTHLDAATRATRRSYQLTEPSRGIVPLPGAAYLLVAEVGGLSLRSMDGTVLGVAAEASARIGPSPVAVVPRGMEFDVLTGLQFGHTLHTLNPDGVFAAGFEVD